MGINYELRESDWNPQNMRIINTEDGNEKGVCYDSSKRTWITLLKHISESDLKDTGVEESIHQAIRDKSCGSPDESDNFDVEQEEWVVEKMFWALNDWILT